MIYFSHFEIIHCSFKLSFAICSLWVVFRCAIQYVCIYVWCILGLTVKKQWWDNINDVSCLRVTAACVIKAMLSIPWIGNWEGETQMENIPVVWWHASVRCAADSCTVEGRKERIYCSSTHKNTFLQLEKTLIFGFSLSKNASENSEYNLEYSIINCTTVVNTNQIWQPHKGYQKKLQNLTANFIPRAVFKRHSQK